MFRLTGYVGRHYRWIRHAMLFAAVLPSALQAEVIINGTRIIYPGNSHEMALQLDNVGEEPALLQSWIDNGNPNAQPEDEDVPFVILPPVVRIEPKQGQTLRLMFSGASLPQDRESLFWFNALEIPPQPEEGKSHNYLQFAVRSRIKLFYRPNNLTPSITEAPETLRWSVSKQQLTIDNPSPYYITLATVELNGYQLADLSGKMLEPHGQLVTKLTGKLATASHFSGHFTNIHDFGASNDHTLTMDNP